MLSHDDPDTKLSSLSPLDADRPAHTTFPRSTARAWWKWGLGIPVGPNPAGHIGMARSVAWDEAMYEGYTKDENRRYRRARALERYATWFRYLPGRFQPAK